MARNAALAGTKLTVLQVLTLSTAFCAAIPAPEVVPTSLETTGSVTAENGIAAQQDTDQYRRDLNTSLTGSLERRVSQTQPAQTIPPRQFSKGLLMEHLMYGTPADADGVIHSNVLSAQNRGKPSQSDVRMHDIFRFWSSEVLDQGPWVQQMQDQNLQAVIGSLPISQTLPIPQVQTAAGQVHAVPNAGVPYVDGGPCLQTWIVNDKAVEWTTATGAEYVNAINVPNGIIIVQGATSPATALSRQQGTREPPTYEHWSDIVFSLWASLHVQVAYNQYWKGMVKDLFTLKRMVKYLNYFVAVDISDAEATNTVSTIMHALKAKHGSQATWTNAIPAWPGVTFYAGEFDFDVILGTPIGEAIGWFIAQHKAPLGRKMIESATVFSLQPIANANQRPSIVFKVVDWTQQLEAAARQRRQMGQPGQGHPAQGQPAPSQ